MFEKCRVFKKKIVRVRIGNECCKCGCRIKKNENAVNTTYSYDGRMISVYVCAYCNVGF